MFFETDAGIDLASFADGLEQAGAVAMNPVAQFNAERGVGAAHRRYKRNWHSMRAQWTKLLNQTYARPLPEGSRAFWACLRRAFPDAMTDAEERERALANTGLIYAAGSETTVNAIACALGALALDSEARAALEQVWRPRVWACKALARVWTCAVSARAWTSDRRGGACGRGRPTRAGAAAMPLAMRRPRSQA